MKISWTVKSFEELSNKELYAILKLRAEVFVVEQNCAYQDLDGKDGGSYHLMGVNEENKLIAYSRLLSPKVSYKEISIGRVVTSPAFRKKGVGKQLMEKSIEEIHKLYGKHPIRIGAQRYLKNFYENFNFVQTSDEYLEDSIPHIEMLKS